MLKLQLTKMSVEQVSFCFTASIIDLFEVPTLLLQHKNINHFDINLNDQYKISSDMAENI